MLVENNHKVLIANRGEIAVRIMQACRKLGLEFVSVYTAEDSSSGHVRLARETGGPKSLYRISSYHDANELLSVADDAGATAVHPGYGFFAEDFRFARRVTERSRPLIFIGPSWRVIRELGDKINTKRLARSLGVPTVPGSDRPIYDELEAEKVARSLFDFQIQQGVSRPLVLVKASAGGGGMGIEEVRDIDLFRSVYRRIRNYAMRQFKDEGVLIEQRIMDFNHLEVQIVSDRSGKNPVHFGTRNCSIQSTGLQKRVEVAPGFDPSSIHYDFDAARVLDDITGHALAMARKVGYDNVGTWEWIVTRDGHPYLMEVNTRIQVENGVSAAIARVNGEKVDLIAEQIRVGLGEPLGYTQENVSFDGVAVEYRIIAEDPAANFTPWVGNIEKFSWEAHPWLSMHTHLPPLSPEAPYAIPTEFDPNLALAIIWGKDLNEVRERGMDFLEHLVLEGRNGKSESLKSDVEFLKQNTARMLRF
ncbi:MAG TPA: acetyl-CoA carboxylase biotin carboxylase subunit [Candidatus Mailhella merdavium]|nr:acetyl-CoA carboxylase biotin carboxylase subunit [Candidatus Mailhella merdavium]